MKQFKVTLKDGGYTPELEEQGQKFETIYEHMSNNTISQIFSGRLGNVFYELCSLFEYCKRFNIPYSNIKLPKTYPVYIRPEDGQRVHFQQEPYIGRKLDGNSINSINENFPMFENIRDCFIDGNEWYKIFIKEKGIIGTKDDLFTDNKCSVFFYETKSTYPSDIVKLVSVNDNEYNRLSKMYDFTNSVAIHIRRGDLLNHEHLRRFMYTRDEIDNAIRVEFDNNKNMRLFVFSEDIPWCKENIKFDNIQFIEGNKPYEDVYLMSMCDRIIKNKSSFNHMAVHIKTAMNYC